MQKCNVVSPKTINWLLVMICLKNRENSSRKDINGANTVCQQISVEKSYTV